MLYEKLDYVIAIAEERNLTRAAKKLFISQPTLTLYLNKLEAELGVKLFDRSKSPLIITEAGTFYIEKMKPIYYAEQMLRNDIQTVAVPAKTLTIGIGQVRGHHWLPILLPALCASYPDINLEITQTAEQDMVYLLKTGAIDIAFGVLPILNNDIETVDLMLETLFFTAHESYGLVPPEYRDQFSPRHPFRIDSERLNGLPFIRPRVSNGLYFSYERALMDNKITPRSTTSVSNLSTGFLLAMKGMGVQLLSGGVLNSCEYSDDALRQMDFFVLEHMPANRRCIAAYQKDNIKYELIQSTIEIVKTQIIPATEFAIPCS